MRLPLGVRSDRTCRPLTKSDVDSLGAALDHRPRMAPRRRRALRLTTKKTHTKAASLKGGDPSAPTDAEWAGMKFFKTFVGECLFIRLILATSFCVSSR